jgi:hypothetical protein
MPEAMRLTSLALLLLVAAHPAPHHGGRFHHGTPSTWRMAAHDGSSPRDFGRTLGHRDAAFVAQEVREPRRLNSFELGATGARLGVGFVGGRHVGLRLKSPF